VHFNVEENQEFNAFWEWGIGNREWEWLQFRSFSFLGECIELRNPVFEKNRVSGLGK